MGASSKNQENNIILEILFIYHVGIRD